jgi:hypothetical protein
MLAFGIQYYITRKAPSKFIYILLVLFLSAIVGARLETVGADTSNYIDFYYTGIAPDKLTGNYEPAFMLVRYFCYYLGFNHFVFFFILAFASLYLWYEVCKKLEIKNYALAFFIYFSMVFLSYQFNTVRNGVMATLVWLAFAFKLEEKNWKAVITLLIAAGFHAVALIFIPILFLIKRKISTRYVFVILIFALFCVFLRLGERLIDMFPILNNIDRVAGYIEVDEDNAYGITLGTIVNITLFLFMFLFYQNKYTSSESFRVILNAMLLAIVVVCVFNSFHAIVSRVGQVLNLSLMFVWPLLINKIKQAPLKLVLCLLLCAYLWLYFSKGLEATELLSGRLTYIPYEWSFNGLFR